MSRRIRQWTLWLALILAGAAGAEPAMPPHIKPADRIDYRDYLEASDHRAFAIAPGGAYGWTSGESSPEVAQRKALDECLARTEQRCVLYAVDERTVFDAKAWPGLWGPYASEAEAARAQTGMKRGQRPPDLVYFDPRGGRHQLSALRGKVIFLHFWGSWCPPCRREMPELQKLYRTLAKRKDIVFVLLQAREDISVSRAWAKQQGLALPFSDSGVAGEEDGQFRLSNGTRINDRSIAGRFPSTYVLDKNGLVLFAHTGPVPDWMPYEAFLRDAAEHPAGK